MTSRSRCRVDPGAEVRFEPPGGWWVRMQSIYFQALPSPISLVTAPRTPSRQQAIERMWGRLVSLSEAGSLYREFETDQPYQAVQWDGTQWVRSER